MVCTFLKTKNTCQWYIIKSNHRPRFSTCFRFWINTSRYIYFGIKHSTARFFTIFINQSGIFSLIFAFHFRYSHWAWSIQQILLCRVLYPCSWWVHGSVYVEDSFQCLCFVGYSCCLLFISRSIYLDHCACFGRADNKIGMTEKISMAPAQVMKFT